MAGQDQALNMERHLVVLREVFSLHPEKYEINRELVLSNKSSKILLIITVVLTVPRYLLIIAIVLPPLELRIMEANDSLMKSTYRCRLMS